MTRFPVHALTLTLAIALVGCAEADDTETTGSTAVEDPILDSVDNLLAGAPGNDELPREDKSDENFPATFFELVDQNSPVKSQGKRGVCSIFSTAAYMEHLYIIEGSKPNLDVSEQYLQWSAKFEVERFPNTSGSNAGANLDAIHRFGVPEENAWPYEIQQWGTADDPDCDGEDTQPTRCYTNGAPPDEAMQAEKFNLPRSRFISTFGRSIKAHMHNKKQGVVVGLTFFYQSWNHRKSELPRNMEYWANGYVLAPNAKDRELSLVKRAGHSILLVGWDDTLEVPIMNEEGEQVLDENGKPKVEKGFFIFKNSWGTGSFGDKNPHGNGYGFISYDYVEEFGSGRVADLPTFETPEEICGDGIDNDENGAADCDDAVCVSTPVCSGGTGVGVDFEGGASIPDNLPSGLVIPATVTDTGPIEAATLSVNITHPFRGDISIELTHPDGTVIKVRESSGDGLEDIDETFVLDDLVGKEAAGEYVLKIVDNARVDTGTLNSARLDLVL